MYESAFKCPTVIKPHATGYQNVVLAGFLMGCTVKVKQKVIQFTTILENTPLLTQQIT
jgi:ABC-type polysaccharide/polyol phosphate transport system ATPase subunit